jgi:hypothetical protein
VHIREIESVVLLAEGSLVAGERGAWELGRRPGVPASRASAPRSLLTERSAQPADGELASEALSGAAEESPEKC